MPAARYIAIIDFVHRNQFSQIRNVLHASDLSKYFKQHAYL